MAVADTFSDLTDKLPPQNLDAERALLGCMLLSNETIDEVADVVQPRHFYLDKHRRIAEAVYRLYENSYGGVDAVTLSEELQKQGELEEIGGLLYLNEILETVPHAAHVKHYATIVQEKAMLRELREACRQILRDVHEDSDDTGSILTNAERKIFQILEFKGSAQNLEIRDILIEVYEALNERWHKDGNISGVSTGFEKLDELTTGLHPSDLIILAARPSMGKTAFACNMAYAVARSARRQSEGDDAGDSHTPPGGVLMFSLEQSKLELAERFLCIAGRIDGHRLKRNEIEDEERNKIHEAASELSPYPIFIDDQGGRTMAEVGAIARRMKRRYGIGLIIVDYLQLIEPDDRGASREQQVAQIARRLKYLAKDINVPVIALAQLNRGVELRPDKRPRLADLRESGAIEQDADLVMFLHRPEVYAEDKNNAQHHGGNDQPLVNDEGVDIRGLAEVVVAKHRNGPTGIINLTWVSKNMRFADRTVRDEPHGAHLQDFEYGDRY